MSRRLPLERWTRSGRRAAARDDEADPLPSPRYRCAFASFGGIFFGYDSGYINGVLSSRQFITAIQGADADEISASNTSLIVSILSAGTFFVRLSLIPSCG